MALAPEDSAPNAPSGRMFPRRPRCSSRRGTTSGGAVDAGPRKLGDALADRLEVRSVAITGLFVLAVLYTLYFARAFLLPIVLAILLDFLLSPVIRALKRLRIPEPLGAAIVILALVGGIGRGDLHAGRSGTRMGRSRRPQSLAKVQGRLRELRRPVEQMTQTAEQVEAATEVSKPGPQEVVVRGPRLSERLFGSTQSFIVGVLETLILLYFLLAVGDLFLQKLIKVLPQLRDKKKAVAIARETEASISTYLLTVAVVNVGLGVAVTLVMLLIGDAERACCGASLAALLEFIPYLGATVMMGHARDGRTRHLPDVGHAAARAGRVPRHQPGPGEPRHPDGAGAPPHAEPGGDLHRPRLLVLDLGDARRVHRGARCWRRSRSSATTSSRSRRSGSSSGNDRSRTVDRADRGRTGSGSEPVRPGGLRSGPAASSLAPAPRCAPGVILLGQPPPRRGARQPRLPARPLRDRPGRPGARADPLRAVSGVGAAGATTPAAPPPSSASCCTGRSGSARAPTTTASRTGSRSRPTGWSSRGRSSRTPTAATGRRWPCRRSVRLLRTPRRPDRRAPGPARARARWSRAACPPTAPARSRRGPRPSP